MTGFGKRLKKILHEKGMTYSELASKCYISENTIYYYINKGVLPNYDYLKSICQVLGVSADYLMGLEEKQ